MKVTTPLAALTLVASTHLAAQGPDPDIALYKATYEAEYKGKSVGTSQFGVSYDAERDVYRFESRLQAKGLLKLLAPNPVLERSDFRSADGVVQPLEYTYEDGSRKGGDNVHAVFDWDAGRAIVDDENGRHELGLESGVLDRGSLQVVLMRDLARTGQLDRYWLADGDSLKAYEYVRQGEEIVRTGIGDLPTLAFVQQREGSSRSTWLWVAPTLGYLPVRIEQRRDGEVRTAFTLAAVEGLPAE